MPMPVERQVMILFAGVNDFLADIEVSKILEFQNDFFEYMDTHHRDVGKAIAEQKVLSDEIKAELSGAIDEFKKVFLARV